MKHLIQIEFETDSERIADILAIEIRHAVRVTLDVNSPTTKTRVTYDGNLVYANPILPGGERNV